MARRGLSRQSGVSLVELMVGLLVGLLLIAGVIALFLQTKRNFNQDEQIARMQENARFAMNLLVRDLSMADFWGGMPEAGAIVQHSGLSIGEDCGTGWTYNLSAPVQYVRATTAAALAAAFPCVSADEVFVVTGLGSNALAIKHVAGSPTETPDAGSVYLRTNTVQGTLFLAPASAVQPEGADWQFQAHIYYVAEEDGVPVLMRTRLGTGSPPSLETEELAEGVEYFNVQFGLDTNGDGVANRYTANPAAADMPTAVAARIYLLVRSTEPDRSYTNTKSYYLGEGDPTTLTVDDNFYRRLYTTTVALRNPANMRRLGGF
jgi:type IV pilus assembly protein PilW